MRCPFKIKLPKRRTFEAAFASRMVLIRVIYSGHPIEVTGEEIATATKLEEKACQKLPDP